MKAFWCKRGHLLAGSNVKLSEEGGYLKRRCVTCRRLHRRNYRIRLRAAA